MALTPLTPHVYAFPARPPARPGGQWPVLVVVPGGGFMSTVRSEGTHTCRHFASRGYVCVWLHYRRYVDAVPMQAMIADVARAVQCVRANAAAWGLDARRVAATGYSAGATLAATLPARDTCREALRAAAPALHDVASAQSFVPDVLLLHYGLYDDPERHAYLLQALYEARAREVNPDAGRWDWRLSEEALAPRRHVRRGAWPPTLLTHGDCDRMVDVEESRAMSRVLEIHGVPHAYVEFAEEDHGYACGTRLPLGDIVPVLGKWVDKFADKFNSIDMFMRTDTRVYLRRTLEYLLNAVFRSGLEADCNWMDRAVAFMAEHAPAVT